MNIYHPSIDRYKKYRPTATPALVCIGPEEGCFYSGLFIWSRKIDTNIRLNNAQNSAVANKDVRIYNAYQDNTKYYDVNDFTSLSDNTSLPPLDQGQNGCCQLMPYMHQIQNSLNFPVDIGSLISCLGTSAPPNTPADLNQTISVSQSNTPDDASGVANFYGKLSNLLFSGECIPIYEAPANIDKCGSDGLPLGNSDLQKDKDCGCPPAKTGIKVTAKKITTPQDPRDLYGDFKKNGPRSIVLVGKDLGKLWLHHNGHNNWNDLRDLYTYDIYERIESLGANPDEIMGFNNAHAVTLTNVTENSDSTYTIELTNSWGKQSNKININYEDKKDLILASTNSDAGSNYVIEITTCTPSTGSSCDEEDNDHEAACKALGYDGIDKNKDGCVCICEEDRYYSASKNRCVCKKGPDIYPCSGYESEALSTLQKTFNIVPITEITIM
jgi:hypothetical protein